MTTASSRPRTGWSSNGYVTDDIQYMEASTESGHIIAQANAIFGDDRQFINPLVEARVEGEFAIVPREEVTLMDISPGSDRVHLICAHPVPGAR
jgi:DNA-directed RNA polymerase beta subunit